MQTILIFTLLLFSNTLLANDSLPVMVGGNGDMDACPTLGVSNSNNKKSSTPVHSAPSNTSTVTDQLANDRFVWICSEKGTWIGIVYSTTDDINCDVSKHINPAQAYKGKCKSGWIPQSNVSPAAG